MYNARARAHHKPVLNGVSDNLWVLNEYKNYFIDYKFIIYACVSA